MIDFLIRLTPCSFYGHARDGGHRIIPFSRVYMVGKLATQCRGTRYLVMTVDGKVGRFSLSATADKAARRQIQKLFVPIPAPCPEKGSPPVVAWGGYIQWPCSD